MEMENQLVELCLNSACESKDSVEKWRRQKRSLERLPSHLADALLRRLHARRLLYPSLLEVVKYTIEVVDLSGENAVDSEWMAYIGAFRYLRSLNVSNCHRLSSSGIWAVAGMTTLRELNISRCLKVTDAGIRHLLSIPTLEKLCIAETGITARGVTLLSSLKTLMFLDLGGLPVTDQALSSLQVLTKLHHLDLWGSKISSSGSDVLQMFPKLNFLNIAWTNVTKFPNLPHLECLNMSNCIIDSTLKGPGDKVPLKKLIASGATFSNETEDLGFVGTSFLYHLDFSNASLHRFCFLTDMKALEYLDLSSTTIGDNSIKLIASVGENLKNLNLSCTTVSSSGVRILAGKLPKLETLSLSHTMIDDVALSYISTMPSLKSIDLSETDIKGYIHLSAAEGSEFLSLTKLRTLDCLEMLNLEHTHVDDGSLRPLSKFPRLSHLLIRSPSFTDVSLSYLSILPNLKTFSIRDAVLTNQAFDFLKPAATLQKIDLRGCWLLTEDGLLEFHRRFPQIEVRHELFHFLSDPTSSNRPSTHLTPKKLRLNQRNRSTVTSPYFVDQRLKYSREELLALQFSSLAHSSTSTPETSHKSDS
ncbi:F-box/LRR-repeat protein 14 isoform X1 [Cucurbita moschata]|uniref:F-box/LRR-repeat protein 14 isoform X1 n=1 Tax=Cucurbita moschata TaxID=3662 RepID=A0A6J1FQB0_CUCMO|nr:F-box/LRR-repeat protein 14 isoform X1 [Cucurbita moschata]XP_022942089.1 F-box/LRR-repeat protein 14 isoform X1 [Cucurbita moschata]XP_022942090.1 F-box/LRR-repeat protein 14 isoform X1 [Cucurbita moschata]